MPGTGKDPRITVHLNLREIMDVIESLPEGHSIIPMLQQKRETLLAIYKLKFKPRNRTWHYEWCRQTSDKCVCPTSTKERH